MSMWTDALAVNPMIAILRGLQPDRSIDVADVLVEAGFRIIEVPLNSPDALSSIRQISKKYRGRVVVGAGTVLTPEQVTAVVDAGGQIIVAPNMDPEVGARAIELGAEWCPGVLTPTEAFAALRLGASILKIFPAELAPPAAIKAMRAVLPKSAIVAAVGGITPETMAPYFSAGSESFGLGSALFKPDYSLEGLSQRAKAFVQAYAMLENP